MKKKPVLVIAIVLAVVSGLPAGVYAQGGNPQTHQHQTKIQQIRKGLPKIEEVTPVEANKMPLEITATKTVTIPVVITDRVPSHSRKGVKSQEIPQILQGWSFGYDGIYLEWSPLASASYYRVYRGIWLFDMANESWTEEFVNVGEVYDPVYYDLGLGCGSGFDYYVAAVMSDGSESWPSNIAWAQTSYCVQPVSNVWWYQDASLDGVRSDVTLGWEPADGALSYRVYWWEPGMTQLAQAGFTYETNFQLSLPCDKTAIVWIESEAWGHVSEWTAITIQRYCFAPLPEPISVPADGYAGPAQYHAYAPLVGR